MMTRFHDDKSKINQDPVFEALFDDVDDGCVYA